MKGKKYFYILTSLALVFLIISISDLFASKDMDKEIEIKMGKILTEEFGCVD